MLNRIILELGNSEIIMVIIALIILMVLVPFTVIDSLKSKRLTVVQKMAWVVFIIIAPYLGAIVYLFWGRRQKTL